MHQISENACCKASSGFATSSIEGFSKNGLPIFRDSMSESRVGVYEGMYKSEK